MKPESRRMLNLSYTADEVILTLDSFGGKIKNNIIGTKSSVGISPFSGGVVVKEE